MKLSADRLSGGFFLLFGLAAYFLVIPQQVEVTESRNLAAATLPNWLSLVIAGAGAVLLVKPTAHELQPARSFLATAAFVAVLAAGIAAMSRFGFVLVAPVLAFVLMTMIGERRPLWLIGGAVATPAAIWFFVVHVLDRALP